MENMWALLRQVSFLFKETSTRIVKKLICQAEQNVGCVVCICTVLGSSFDWCQHSWGFVLFFHLSRVPTCCMCLFLLLGILLLD
jgi:hypothetical protein